ncbi:hypothetical protein V6N11_002063 [Hibiscus sabdariffa]|uniref:RNase H type-1 domain-containing protein n=1 Tax=Hibiscus sabdariffa TaxID=183260 RepID=A0ABR2QUB3_9ROSI
MRKLGLLCSSNVEQDTNQLNGSIIKLNFDASFNSASNSSVSGIVARDSHGFILAACTCPHRGIADAFIAEAVACEKAVSFALDLGFRSVQIEGDSLSVIKKINSTAMDKSIISPIIGDIKALSVNFVSVTFSFVGRRGNVVAHELARFGDVLPYLQTFSAPPFLEHIVSVSSSEDCMEESSSFSFPRIGSFIFSESEEYKTEEAIENSSS